MLLSTTPEVIAHCSPSLPTQSSRSYQTDMYQPLSPSYQPHIPSSPQQLDECQVKFNPASDEDFSKEQDDRQQEPTYITLTSPQRHVEDSNDDREYNSCRLSHITRSSGTACSPLDNVVYPPQPTQVTRVDAAPAALHSHRPMVQRETFPGPHMSHTRRSPASLSLRQTLGSPDTLNTVGSFQRGNSSSASYSSSALHHDPSTSPFQINNDPSSSNYPTPSSSYGNLSTPYGYYCNEMFPTSGQQTYRNRSINITLTYN
ncbi:hypothetical protein Btru_065130 [Bulinus truncatus]|nr:hypothetical protein Btru_065130 [Bulinus truncatus]